MSIVQKLMDLMGKNAHKAGPAIDKAGDEIDRRTGGKHKDKVDMAQQRAKETAEEMARRQQRPRS